MQDGYPMHFVFSMALTNNTDTVSLNYLPNVCFDLIAGYGCQASGETGCKPRFRQCSG